MEKRESTVAALLAIKSNQDIMEELKVSRKTIYAVKKRLLDGKGLANNKTKRKGQKLKRLKKACYHA